MAWPNLGRNGGKTYQAGQSPALRKSPRTPPRRRNRGPTAAYRDIVWTRPEFFGLALGVPAPPTAEGSSAT